MAHRPRTIWRLVTLPVAMLIALAIAPTVAAGNGPAGTVFLEFNDCQAHMVVTWSHLPGNLKTYEVDLENTVDSTAAVVGSDALDRTGGSVDAYANRTPDGSAWIWQAHVLIRDGKGNLKDTWDSGLVSAPCV